MLVMTAKVDKKKIALILAGILVLIIGLVVLLGGNDTQPTSASAAASATAIAGNEDRINFLKGFGWEVTTSPKESSQVRIPKDSSEVFERYNTLQKSQGYDLTPYAGQTVMRYVYQVNNYPGATEPVYATLLISKNQVIGGDITDTGAKGKIRGFQKPQEMPEATGDTKATEATEATEATNATEATEAPSTAPKT